MSDLTRTIEALLFLSPQPVNARDLAEATEATEGQVAEAIELLREDLAEGKRGVVLREVAGGFALASDPASEAAARRLLAKPRTPPLTQAQAETLAIVAYLQPVTRPEVARIRGVTSESAVQTLAERGLIEESGRSQFGAAIFKTTELFERLFGLSGLDQLPDPSQVRSDAGGRAGAAGATAQGGGATSPSLEVGGGPGEVPPEQQRGGSVGTSPGPLAAVRLAKFLAHGGVASRRKAELIIAKGRVTVGGEVVTDPARDVGDADEVRVDGSLVGTEAREVWAVNKPAGVVSTAREPGRRPAVVELVDYGGAALSGGAARCRLDRAAAADQRRGAGQPAHASALRGRARPTGRSCGGRRRTPICGGWPAGWSWRTGMTAPAEVRRLGEREIEIVLREGRNRQVRRMAEAIGNRVVTLRRVRFGPIELGRLPQGQARRLGEDEIARLWEDSER